MAADDLQGTTTHRAVFKARNAWLAAVDSGADPARVDALLQEYRQLLERSLLAPATRRQGRRRA